MKQLALASRGFEKYGRATQRSVFQAQVDRVIPWAALCALVEPVHSKNEAGRPGIGVDRMLRIDFLQGLVRLVRSGR
jgi:IS5 family transposase